MKKYIRCPTQEIWDFVVKHSNITFNHAKWENYKEQSSILYNSNEYAGLDFYKKHLYEYEEISLSDYCLEKGIENPFEKDNEKLLTTIL